MKKQFAASQSFNLFRWLQYSLNNNDVAEQLAIRDVSGCDKLCLVNKLLLTLWLSLTLVSITIAVQWFSTTILQKSFIVFSFGPCAAMNFDRNPYPYITVKYKIFSKIATQLRSILPV